MNEAEILKYARLVENALGEYIGIAIVDACAKINYANKKFCLLSGYSCDELLDRNYCVLHSGFYCKEIEVTLQNTISSGLMWKENIKICTKEGICHWVDVTLSPAPDTMQSSTKYYIVMWADISDYKQSEEKMRTQINELERSNNELEQFAYVVTHDLQEPLRAISSFVQLLKKYYNERLDDRANILISHVVSGIGRMQELIDDLLSYAQIDGTQVPAEVDCDKLLNDVLADLSVIIHECNAVVTHDKLPVIKGIPFQLLQLFNNLISNGLKFRREQPPKIHIGIEENSTEWVFSVTDNGIGIEEHFLERIFKIFQRLHSRREYVGTGIGLSICKKVVEYHKGRIWINSKPNVGSTVFFSIPKSI
ncbi:MAG: PAS domain S-box protein [Nitrosomonas sp. PRO4]|nr:PAS domain S-box protein [Nitrosomonas sp. PRO4]